MARQRRPVAASKARRAAATTPTDEEDDRSPELIAANALAEQWLARRLETPDDHDVIRQHEAARDEAERLGSEWAERVVQAFKLSHVGRSAVAVQPFTPPAPREPASTSRLRGETPLARVRKSQRATPRRDERERIAKSLGIDPDLEHARHAGAQRERLQALRSSWPSIVQFRRGLELLRSGLVGMAALSSETRTKASAHASALERLVPPWCRSAEDAWLPFASEDLNDDEIAEILVPVRYKRDRNGALNAIRKRRSELERVAREAATPFPSELERRRRRIDPVERGARRRKHAAAIHLGDAR